MSIAIVEPVINENGATPPLLSEDLSNSSSLEDEHEQVLSEELDQDSDIIGHRSNRNSNTPRLGPYVLLKTLGVGEFGKVKMGKHIETGLVVAIKLIKKENIDSSSQLDKIRMEIGILKILNHPYIVKLLSVNETTNCIGMVLEYAQGGELFEYIYRQKFLKEEEARRLFSQLISCVRYLHQKNIVHRDLKLENLLLDCNGNLIVTDFGFANQFVSQAGDLMSTSCGSPVYAAPELVMTGRLYAGMGVDVWSCGIVLYAMLCGYLPFDDDAKNPNGDNISRLYRYIMVNQPKYPRHITTDAKDLIGKMLMPDPKKRCTIEDIIEHVWLIEYKEKITKPIEELEIEAQDRKKELMQGCESEYDKEYIKNDSKSCSPLNSSISSACSSPTPSIYKHRNEKIEQQVGDNVTEQIQLDIVTNSTHNQDSNSGHNVTSSKLMQDVENNTLIPVAPTNRLLRAFQLEDKPKNTKRHTIEGVFPFINKSQPQKQEVPANAERPPISQKSLSLRTRLFSSVRVKHSSSNLDTKDQKASINKRASWQETKEQPHNKATKINSVALLPPSPPSPSLTLHPKTKSRNSLRIVSWLHRKSTTSVGESKKSIATTESYEKRAEHEAKEKEEVSLHGNTPTHSNSNIISSEDESSGTEYDGIHINNGKECSSKHLHAQKKEKIPSSPIKSQAKCIEEELRIHHGDMNRSVLTSKLPMEVLIEINKILLILGIEVENKSGYKLHCKRRSMGQEQPGRAETENDLMSHLSSSNTTVSNNIQMSTIYGHPSIDKGNEINFTIEICRFEKLSGLFSVDIQQCGNEREDDNGWQFIGQKLLSFLQMGNVIRNTNFAII